MNDDDDLSFESYNAMGRTASYFGIPQFILLGIIAFSIIIIGISCAIFSWYGLISVVIPITLFVVVRFLCESDSRFLTRLRFMLRRYLRNVYYGRALLITPCNPRWTQFYGRRIAQKRYVTGN